MSYNPNIPQPTDPILVSQPQILANFQAINTTFADNHVALTKSNTIAGMHSVMTMRPEGGDPTTTAGQVALYNKLVSSIPELFFRPQSNATPIQLTYPSINTGTAAPYPTDQYTFMAGPFIIYGGSMTNVHNGDVKALSPGTTLLYVGLIPTTPGIGVFPNGLAATNLNTPANAFTIRFFTAFPFQNLYYFAIGI